MHDHSSSVRTKSQTQLTPTPCASTSEKADPRGGGSGRVANAVFYDSPAFANTELHVSYSPESVPGDRHKNKVASLVYNDGTFRAMVGAARNSRRAHSAGLLGKVGALTLMGMYNVSESAAGSEAKTTTLGAMYTIGATTLRAGWGQADVDGVKRERIVAVGAAYRLSKRSALFADVASKRFRPTDGTKTVLGVGVAHSF